MATHYARVTTRTLVGLDAPRVSVEVHLSNGLPAVNIVGLPEAAVRESRERVRSAITNTRYEFPRRRVTVNLAPADLPKTSAWFDLPIAIGLLAASAQVPADALSRFEFCGELALDGSLRGSRGLLPVAIAARADHSRVILPSAAASDAALAGPDTVYGVDHLAELLNVLVTGGNLEPTRSVLPDGCARIAHDLDAVRGQAQAKRAVLIAAAGGHNLLLCGPPGTGKSMLAERLPRLLPPLTAGEYIEVAAVGCLRPGQSSRQHRRRPYRQPHHGASAAALIGGGPRPLPGEISLAHHGVLFLDELPEFDRRVLESLREPMETGRIHLARANHSASYPARFQLVAAMNPCPCGYHGDSNGRCRCTLTQVHRYRERISGPLLDRIDLKVHMAPLPASELTSPVQPSKVDVQGQVDEARERQRLRGVLNARLDDAQLETHARLSADQQGLLTDAIRRLGLSARATVRVRRVARTIADLEQADAIQAPHLLEALGLQRLTLSEEVSC